jgi:hypothetical protein
MMSEPHFREITERRLSEDYDYETPLDLNLVRSNAQRKASQQLILRKRSSIQNWDKSDLEYSPRSLTTNDLFREIALIKLLIDENDSLFKTKVQSSVKKNLTLKKSLVHKYFHYLNSNEIWSLMCKKTNCGNTFYQCITQPKETILGYVSLSNV